MPPQTLREDELFMQGWCFRAGSETPPKVTCRVVMRDTDTSAPDPFVYTRAAREMARPDVVAAWPDERVHPMCGFVCRLPVLRPCILEVTLWAQCGDGAEERFTGFIIDATPPERDAPDDGRANGPPEIEMKPGASPPGIAPRSRPSKPKRPPLAERLYYEWMPRVVSRMRLTRYGDFAQHAPRPMTPERFPRPSQAKPEALPRFVIVTPSYNQADFLEATMRSVLDQTGVRIDYIVMDGGSTDGSVDIIAQHAPRLAHHTSGPDGGQSAAIAAGLARASCGPDDVMAYLNSDDLYMPGALRFVAEYMARHPEIDAVYGHRVIIDETGLETGRWFTHRHNATITLRVDLVPQETLFWRKRIYDKVQGIDPAFRFAMDWDLITRFISAGARMVRLPWFLGAFRVHSTSKTSTLWESVGAVEADRIRVARHGRPLSQTEVLAPWYRATFEANVLSRLWRWGIRL